MYGFLFLFKKETTTSKLQMAHLQMLQRSVLLPEINSVIEMLVKKQTIFTNSFPPNYLLSQRNGKNPHYLLYYSRGKCYESGRLLNSCVSLF